MLLVSFAGQLWPHIGEDKGFLGVLVQDAARPVPLIATEEEPMNGNEHIDKNI